MDWDQFVKAMNKCLMKFYAAMDTGSRMCILMGDIKRNGKCYSMLRDICQPGVLENIVIKMQHNCVSDARTYSNQNFIPIVHEYIMILKKLSAFMMDYMLPQKHELDIRDSANAIWRDVVLAALRNIGGEGSTQDLYDQIRGHKKCENNPNWEAKVRQTLQIYDIFVSTERSRWAIA